MKIKVEKDEKMFRMRHSLAHIMAAAIQRIYKDAKFGVGPAIEDGFYYDIDLGENKISEKNFNKIELGFYSQAKTLQDLPNTTLTSALVSVTYPVFSSIQHDVEKLRQYYLKTLNLIIYIIGPIMLGLIVVANPLFEFVSVSCLI